MMQQQNSPQEQNEDTYESLISLIENSQGRLAPIIVACDDWALRQRVIDRYEAEAREAKIIPYRVVLGREPSVRAALARLKEENEYLQRSGEAVFTVTGAETLLRVKLKPDDEQSELDKFFGYLQWTREGLREFRYPIVLWVTYRILKEMSRRAPDFWSWRKAVLRFKAESDDLISLAASTPIQLAQIEPQSNEFLPPLEELQAEIQQLETTSPDSPNLATLYEKLGQVYADRVTSGKAVDLEKDREAAIAAFQTAIQQYQKLDRKSAQAAALTKLGDFLYSQSRFTEAIEPDQQSLKLALELGEWHTEILSLSSLIKTYISLGQYQQVAELQQQMLKALETDIGLDNHQGKVNSSNDLSIARSIEQYPQAIDVLQRQQMLEIIRKSGYRQGEASALCSLGSTYILMGQYQQAIEMYQQALEIAHKMSDQQGKADALDGLGQVYSSLGQYQRAIELYQQSLEIERKVGNRHGEASTLFDQALALASLDQYEECLKKLQQAKKLYVAIGVIHMVEKCEITINALNQIIVESFT